MEFVNKATGLKLQILMRKVKMNVCNIWPLAEISDDFYYLGIWQCTSIRSSLLGNSKLASNRKCCWRKCG